MNTKFEKLFSTKKKKKIHHSCQKQGRISCHKFLFVRYQRLSIRTPPGDSINNYEITVSRVIGSVLISLHPVHTQTVSARANDAIKFQHDFFFKLQNKLLLHIVCCKKRREVLSIRCINTRGNNPLRLGILYPCFSLINCFC
jgi:hypothetical protein